jgi:cell division septal protein FtsQ
MFYLGLFPIFIIALIFILFGPIFSVQNIQIFRDDNITEMNLAYSSVDNIREKRIINIDEENIKTRIKEYQNNIKDINISFTLPNTIKINLASYPIYFNTIIHNKPYYITQN